MTDFDRFIIKVEKTESCWHWKAYIHPNGYGRFKPSWKKNTTWAHRVSYELFVGNIPDGMCVLHHCDVRRCVNPDHLYVGRPQENYRDVRVRLRAAGERNGAAKFNDADVEAMLGMLSCGAPRATVAILFDTSYHHLSQIARGERWGFIQRGGR